MKFYLDIQGTGTKLRVCLKFIFKKTIVNKNIFKKIVTYYNH